jgi:hypothetical protein
VRQDVKKVSAAGRDGGRGGAVMSGTPAEDLLGLYLESGHPVVALDGSHRGDETGRLIRLRRHPETDALLTAVWRLASRNGTPPRASEKAERL